MKEKRCSTCRFNADNSLTCASCMDIMQRTGKGFEFWEGIQEDYQPAKYEYLVSNASAQSVASRSGMFTLCAFVVSIALTIFMCW